MRRPATRTSRRFWRVFPWDPAARPGAPFSARFVATSQHAGRFDLDDRPRVLYLAEAAEHAIAEKLQRFRGRPLREAHLREFGRPLALVEVAVATHVVERIADLTDPKTLVALGIRPDQVASHERTRTQALARAVHQAGHTGLRWWSMLTGEWHTVVLFLDRVRSRELEMGDPVRLVLNAPELRRAATFLGLRAPR